MKLSRLLRYILVILSLFILKTRGNLAEPPISVHNSHVSTAQVEPHGHQGQLTHQNDKHPHQTTGGHGHGSNEGGGGNGHEGHGNSIHVSTVDFAHVSYPFIISVWILLACFSKIGFHMVPKLGHIFPESVLLIVIGVLIGLALFYTDSLTPPLTPSTFFLFMLPPIILDAGYFMPNHLFFNNLGTILLFAVIGTLWNTFTIGVSLWGLGKAGAFGVDIPILPMFLFTSLISAVDPVAVLAVFEEIHVNEVLYIVVFGESLLNDAVTVVLYHIFEAFSAMGQENVTVSEVLKGVASFPVVALGGTAIGIIWGFLIGLTTRYTNHVRVIEPLFIFVMAYLSYLCAEVFHMSGILAITFCGIAMKNYVEANISTKSHATVKYGMKMMASSSETIIFIFLGVATIQDQHEWNWAFVTATIAFCSIFRVIGVILFTWLANKYRVHKLSVVDQFVMSYGGLRGAVAFALVLLIELETVQGDEKVRRMFVTTTITVVFFTVFVQGITIKPLVQWLKVTKAEKRKPTMNERIHEKLMEHTMAGVEGLMKQFGHYSLREWFKKFDKSYLRPLLVRDWKGDEPKILETYSKLMFRETISGANKTGKNNLNNLSPSQMTTSRVSPTVTLTKQEVAVLIREMEKEGNLNLTASRNPSRAPSLAQLSIATDARRFSMALLDDSMEGVSYNANLKQRKSAPNSNSELQERIPVSGRGSGVENIIGGILLQPQAQPRRFSYSRHAVNEDELDTEYESHRKASLYPVYQPCLPTNRDGKKGTHHHYHISSSGHQNAAFEWEIDRPVNRVIPPNIPTVFIISDNDNEPNHLSYRPHVVESGWQPNTGNNNSNIGQQGNEDTFNTHL